MDQQNDMRCYLFMNGQCARFIAEDVLLLLPYFFEDTKENKKFVESPEARHIINRMKMKGKLIGLFCFLSHAFGVILCICVLDRCGV